MSARKPAPSARPAARRSAASPRSGMPGWVGVIVGLSVGLFVAVLVYLGHGRKISTPLAPSSAQSAARPAAAVPVPPKTPSRYSFYQMLPSYEVVIPPDETAKLKKGKPLPAELASPGSYILQAGAYRTRQEADALRARLALAGVESRIEQVTLDPSNIWYRVRVGPEPSVERARVLLERLQGEGVHAMLIKVKTPPPEK